MHRVDRGIRQQLGYAAIAGAAVGTGLLLGPLRRPVPQPRQARPGAARYRLGVQVGHHPRADESDSQLLHAFIFQVVPRRARTTEPRAYSGAAATAKLLGGIRARHPGLSEKEAIAGYVLEPGGLTLP